ncbi:RecX family transcriptional regulator [candidate division TA06 bacterium]|nr:RecX family transcriptional regulator [candidate division TA06 bacterium]
MKITKIEVQKKHPHRRSIFLDGEFFKGVDEEVVVRLGLKKDQDIDEERIHEILLSEEKRKAKEYGLNLLSFRGRSIGEMRQRLEERGFEEEIVDSVVKELKEMEFLDDLKFAREWVRSRMEGSPKGSYGLRLELQEKKVSDVIIHAVLEEYSEKYDEREVARTLAMKRMRVLANKERGVIQGRLADFLTRRGFSYNVIKDVVHEFSHGMPKENG